MLFLAGWLGAREMKIVTSDSVCLYVNVRGIGTPCLYLHGGPGSGSLWLEEFMGDYLEKNFQMVYLDQRGVGRSSSPVNGVCHGPPGGSFRNAHDQLHALYAGKFFRQLDFKSL